MFFFGLFFLDGFLMFSLFEDVINQMSLILMGWALIFVDRFVVVFGFVFILFVQVLGLFFHGLLKL